MYNHLAPEYLCSLIPQQVNDISRYNLRNSHNIQTIKAKTNQFNNSFLPSTLRDWNNLPIEAKQANTLGSFKYFLKKDKKVCAKIFLLWKQKGSNTSDPTTNRLQFSESWPLWKISLTHPYATVVLLKMHNITFSTVDSTNDNAPSLSQEINQNIFAHVHRYILETQRF